MLAHNTATQLISRLINIKRLTAIVGEEEGSSYLTVPTVLQRAKPSENTQKYKSVRLLLSSPLVFRYGADTLVEQQPKLQRCRVLTLHSTRLNDCKI